jgi:hypothetical protein
MSTNTEAVFLAIYKHLVPKIQPAQLAAEIHWTRRKDASEYPTGIAITSDDGRLYSILSLYNKADDGIINNYRWEYMDCMTGAIIDSTLDYTAADDEVIAFFQQTLETSEEVIRL